MVSVLEAIQKGLTVKAVKDLKAYAKKASKMKK
jgi:hypothetical protein